MCFHAQMTANRSPPRKHDCSKKHTDHRDREDGGGGWDGVAIQKNQLLLSSL